ncbi:UNVERIFIED_CONTAM: hypothetical protein K2H54_038011 [Gekko kuhli]
MPYSLPKNSTPAEKHQSKESLAVQRTGGLRKERPVPYLYQPQEELLSQTCITEVCPLDQGWQRDPIVPPKSVSAVFA